MRKYLIGILIGAALTISSSAFAEDVITLIGQKIQGEFPVKINGTALEKPAIVIDGTSYLPNRAIADALGMDIKFDADLGIELTNKEVQPVPTSESSAIEDTTVSNDLPISTQTIADRNTDLSSVESHIRLTNQAISIVKMSIEENADSTKIAEWNGQITKLQEDLAIWEARKAALTPTEDHTAELATINESLRVANEQLVNTNTNLKDLVSAGLSNTPRADTARTDITNLESQINELEQRKAALTQ